MKKYIALDTNIFVSFLETGFKLATQVGKYSNPQHENVLISLQSALIKNKIELLLPEVVQLELERIYFEKQTELLTAYEDIQSTIGNHTLSGGKKLSQSSLVEINNSLKQICKKEQANNSRIWKLIQNILKHKNTHIIELDTGILLLAYKRGLMGKKPYIIGYMGTKSNFKDSSPAHTIQPDCIIIECLKSYLSKISEYELYFGTNDSGFYTGLEKHELDAEILKEINVKYTSTNASDLINKALGLTSEIKVEMDSEEQSTYPLVPEKPIEVGQDSNFEPVAKGYIG